MIQHSVRGAPLGNLGMRSFDLLPGQEEGKSHGWGKPGPSGAPLQGTGAVAQPDGAWEIHPSAGVLRSNLKVGYEPCSGTFNAVGQIGRCSSIAEKTYEKLAVHQAAPRRSCPGPGEPRGTQKTSPR